MHELKKLENAKYSGAFLKKPKKNTKKLKYWGIKRRSYVSLITYTETYSRLALKKVNKMTKDQEEKFYFFCQGRF